MCGFYVKYRRLKQSGKLLDASRPQSLGSQVIKCLSLCWWNLNLFGLIITVSNWVRSDRSTHATNWQGRTSNWTGIVQHILGTKTWSRLTFILARINHGSRLPTVKYCLCLSTFYSIIDGVLFAFSSRQSSIYTCYIVRFTQIPSPSTMPKSCIAQFFSIFKCWEQKLWPLSYAVCTKNISSKEQL